MDHTQHTAEQAIKASSWWQEIIQYFSEADFMPHGHCYLWKPGLVYTHVISDFLIGTAYVVISLTLYGLVKKINLQFNRVVLCFGVFIGACGWTHYNEIWNLWYSDYWYSGIVKVITAAASVGTGIYLIKLRHPLIQVAEAAKLSEQRKLDLEVLTKDLEERVQERTKTISENEKRLRLAQEVANIGTFEWDIPNNSINWTPELEKLYGLPLGGFEKSFEHWRRLVHPEDFPEAEAAVNSAMEKEYFEAQWRVIWPDGSIHWLGGRGIVEKDAEGKALKMIGVNIDITKPKNLEIERDRLISELKGAIVARDEFLSVASHELKTPLTSLLMQAQLQQRLVSKNDERAYSKEKIDSFIGQAVKSTNRLNRIVDDMLDISRIRSGKLNIYKERIDLCTIVEDTINRMTPQFEQAGSKLPTFSGTKAEGFWDPLRLEQVINNLLTNALKYGDRKEVKVKVENAGSVAKIIITDKGIGISPDFQKKIFDRFERAIDSNEVSGLGLGLYISQQIIEAHNGRIWVESEIGRGSTFYIELPLN